MSYRHELIDLIKDRMVTVEDGVVCSGGETATTYLDIPGVLKERKALQLGAKVLDQHILFNVPHISTVTAIGGPQMGSIPLVMGAVMESGQQNLQWFIVRDEAKDHGLGKMFVGGEPGPGDKVILVDDVASSGGSLMQAGIRIAQTGAEILAIVPLVDRGNQARELFAQDGIPYLPVLTYADLDLPLLGE